ncbi:hypothetical protein ACGFI9_11115 [Micromonospora sp. NPDC048930]|uniref:hypothetical protein n=1 Tax=Micromonospora sp. NPDC048930 TaxID=3364261 RepID=UPI0037232E44
MRLSRIIMALTVGLAVAAVPTAAGAAQPQPGYEPVVVLTVEPPTITLGGSFTLHGSGLAPRTPVRIHVEISALPAAAPAQGTARRSDGSTVTLASVAYAQPQPAPRDFTVTTDDDGEYTVEYRPNRPGRYTFTATGEAADGSTANGEATGTVLPPRGPRPPHQGGGNGHLPVTGASLSTPMKLGGGLAGTGALLLLVSLAWRRRGRFGMGAR